MGYYSEVTIQCGKKAFEMFRETYRKIDFLPDKVYKYEDDDSFIIHYKRVKWYSGYDDVAAIDEIIRKLGKDKYNNLDEYAYKFLRVGEAYDDVEENSNNAGSDLFFDLYPETVIVIPDGGSVMENDAFFDTETDKSKNQ